MPALPAVQLATDELPRGPWVFARSVAGPFVAPDSARESASAAESLDGALVEVYDHSGRFVGHALHNSASDIRLRFVSRGRKTDLTDPARFLAARLRAASRLRTDTLRLPERTDAYRLVHGEGDDLSGLVIDRLGDALVCEYHALGFWCLRAEIERALLALHPGSTVLHRVADGALRPEGFTPHLARAGWREDDAREVEIHECGLTVPVLAGGKHKTGWFCDQRENRVRVAQLARGRFVLDLFCNAGGFALHAAKAGARRVRAVDLDEEALGRAERAARANELSIELRHDDAFDQLRALERERELPELIVLDPHKLIPSQQRYDEGIRRYADLNTLALEGIRPGGLLATFSCSGLLELGQFLGMLFGAARRARREIRLLETLGAGPDHPQTPDFARSRYLKGALLAVDGPPARDQGAGRPRP